jgi:glutamate dehydrogenase (NAD(P)+)
MGTNQQVMAWLLDEYSRRNGYTPAVVTGKPIALGGSLGREEATAQGVVYVMEAYAADEGLPIRDSRVVIQGFGNVGAQTARILHERGARVIAVTDVDGGLHNDKGLDIPNLFDHGYRNRRPVAEFPGGDRITNDALWRIPCDWLIPAALGGVITKDHNLGDLDCRVVVEAANAPTTPIADKELESRGVPVLPDFLVNSGGVIVSYFEWVQNLQQHPWALERVNETAPQDYALTGWCGPARRATRPGGRPRTRSPATGREAESAGYRPGTANPFVTREPDGGPCASEAGGRHRLRRSRQRV